MFSESRYDVCIEDCYISTGDDLIAIKSGQVEYGISYVHPSTNIIIHRLVGQTTSSSGIAIGSGMSGGALPLIEKIGIQNGTGENIKVPGLLEGIEGDTFKRICLSDINLDVRSKSP
ncbi:hypothetical protein POM88_008552 [Heracleum sosnowskyi]|uniref:Uncharacterized protein n=1 Tax=Heracleum sosnowskyi TaxID=360622 RepID=A0AAD8N6M1_9APIA|nr:hypothetical protein POM88_008552 [Heracleum sosnowskyi]